MSVKSEYFKLQVTSAVKERACDLCDNGIQWEVIPLSVKGKPLETIYLCGDHLNGLLKEWAGPENDIKQL